MTIVAAADGSAIGNPGPSGWAWYVDDGCWAAGGWPVGTNNMGELTAVLDLLQQTAHVPDKLLVYCDSTYVINTITKWMAGWKRRGWRKKDGKPVLNVEIIKAIDEAMSGRDVEFVWVKGHSGHELNEAADVRANAAAAAYRDKVAVPAGPGFSGGSSAHPDARVGQIVEEPDLFSTLDEADIVESVDDTTDVDQVVALERALLTDEIRTDPAAVSALLHPDFTEIGASGVLRERDAMLERIAPLDPPVDLEVISCTPVATDTLLLLWRAHSDRAQRLRSSLWVNRGGHWQLRHHQGTPAQ